LDHSSSRSAAFRGRKILLVGNDPDYFLMHRLPLARALAASGADLHVALPFARSDRRFSGHPFDLHGVSLRRGSVNPYMEGQTVMDLLSISRRVRPALVHHVTVKPILYGSVIARLLRTPCVVNSVTGLGYVFSSGSVRAKSLRTLLLPALRYGCKRRNVTMLFENQDDVGVYCSLGITESSRCLVIPSSGINVEDYLPSDSKRESATVMFLGRMLWDKGVGEFVEAARSVRQARPSSRFVLVGAADSNPESVSETDIGRWREERIVEYWGRRSDIAAVLQCADILCLPSYREGLPRALLEGAAAGLALVATDVPGCRDAVRHGVSGLLVPARDSTALARAILSLIDDTAGRREMGAAARRDVASRFSVASVVQKTCAAYAEALGRAL